jgi:hypothetical protein
VGSHAATVLRVQSLDPGLTLKRSELNCASIRKVVVSIVANHNNGCEEMGYSPVTARENGEGEKLETRKLKSLSWGSEG